MEELYITQSLREGVAASRNDEPTTAAMWYLPRHCSAAFKLYQLSHTKCREEVRSRRGSAVPRICFTNLLDE